MSTPPPAKRPRIAESGISTPPKSVDLPQPQPQPHHPPLEPRRALDTAPPPPPPPPPAAGTSNSRKRPASRSPGAESKSFDVKPPPPKPISESTGSKAVPITDLISPTNEPGESKPFRKPRTNTPWTAKEEQSLKQMRDAGKSWSEIAKEFPHRTEGSVKKHWYKDMHYAEFAEDETKALRDAIKEYDANKWKVIGLKLGKPAKACEQFAKDHFKDL